MTDNKNHIHINQTFPKITKSNFKETNVIETLRVERTIMIIAADSHPVKEMTDKMVTIAVHTALIAAPEEGNQESLPELLIKINSGATTVISLATWLENSLNRQ